MKSSPLLVRSNYVLDHPDTGYVPYRQRKDMPHVWLPINLSHRRKLFQFVILKELTYQVLNEQQILVLESGSSRLQETNLISRINGRFHLI